VGNNKSNGTWQWNGHPRNLGSIASSGGKFISCLHCPHFLGLIHPYLRVVKLITFTQFCGWELINFGPLYTFIASCQNNHRDFGFRISKKTKLRHCTRSSRISATPTLKFLRSHWLFLTQHSLADTVELHLPGLIGTSSQSDMQRIRIIGFFFENRLEWQFQVAKNF
jgi:hypothetical protein